MPCDQSSTVSRSGQRVRAQAVAEVVEVGIRQSRWKGVMAADTARHRNASTVPA